MDIDVDGLGLQHVKMLRRSHTEANVALKVSRLVVMPLLARAMLGEVFCRSHDKLCFVCWVGHPLRVYNPMKVSIHSGEMDEGFVIQVRKDSLLDLWWQTFDQGRHGS